jgi:hypothetical protein
MVAIIADMIMAMVQEIITTMIIHMTITTTTI